MTFYKSTLLTFLLSLVTLSLFSQDKIFRKDSSLIECKITEVGLDEIKYHPVNKTSPVFTIDKNLVHKIILEGGTEIIVNDPMKDPAHYANQKKLAIKTSLFAPLTGNTNIIIEKSLRPGRSIEGTFGVIGLSTSELDESPGGAFVKFGYKAIKSPDYYMRGMRYAHILKGTYIRPELTLSYFERDNSEFGSSGREDIFGGALMINIGKQLVFDDIFLIDYFVGGGYGFDTHDQNDESVNHYGYILGNNDFPFAFTAGFRVGMLIK